ncbi:unnamed protein product [Meloidogyne enterolobii]|uniref:Uncharacterized protein n=1 Tax=Meloidogyne enterolobii TaxID=390850 RepID=A0ACB0ZM97_MELEN
MGVFVHHITIHITVIVLTRLLMELIVNKPRPLPFPLPESLSAKFHFSDSWQLEAENLEIKFRPKLGISSNELNKQKKLFVLIDTKSDIINKEDEEKQRLLVAITGSGGLIVHWVFQGNEQSTFNLSSANITNNIHWHSLKLIRRGQRMGLKLDGKWHNQLLNNIENKPLILSINEIAIAQPIGTFKIANNLEHLFRFHGDLRILSLNGHDLLRPIRVMKRQKGKFKKIILIRIIFKNIKTKFILLFIFKNSLSTNNSLSHFIILFYESSSY